MVNMHFCRSLLRLNDRRERGATTVVVAALSTALLAAAGIGVDTGSLAYQRSRLQHAADAAVSAIALDCAQAKSSCSAVGAQSTANYYVTQNAGSGTATVPAVVNTASSSVKVSVTKTVNTGFFGLVGRPSKTVRAEATASMSGHPVVGAPVLPLAVPYCMYAAPPSASPNPFLLRTDIFRTVTDLLGALPIVGTVVSTLLNTLTGVEQSCKSTSGQDLVMLRGPIWLTGIVGVVNSIFTWDSAMCTMHIGDINSAVGSTVSSLVPPTCISKLGTSITKNQIILLPIYEPANNLLQLGFEAKACLLGLSTCVTVPPKLGIKILGYAPFKITGWNFSGNSQNDPNAPACSSIDLLLGISLGCNGIQGYFVKSYTKDPNFTYSPTGADFGASAVAISN